MIGCRRRGHCVSCRACGRPPGFQGRTGTYVGVGGCQTAAQSERLRTSTQPNSIVSQSALGRFGRRLAGRQVSLLFMPRLGLREYE